MYYVLVQYRVEDYRKWRPIFDAPHADRVKASLYEPRVFRNVDHPEELIIQFRCGNLRLAREFTNAVVSR